MTFLPGQFDRLVKAMVFPVVMYGCESWTVKKAEHRRMGAFELWCCTASLPCYVLLELDGAFSKPEMHLE